MPYRPVCVCVAILVPHSGNMTHAHFLIAVTELVYKQRSLSLTVASSPGAHIGGRDRFDSGCKVDFIV